MKFLKETYLIERIDDVRKQYPKIGAGLFDRIIKLDPTFKGRDSVGTYGKWLLNLHKKGERFDRPQHITDVLTQFENVKRRLEQKDIGRYKSLEEVEQALEAVAGTEEVVSKSQSRKDFSKVFENAK